MAEGTPAAEKRLRIGAHPQQETEVDDVKQDIEKEETEIDEMKAEVDEVKAEIREVKHKIEKVEAEIDEMKQKMGKGESYMNMVGEGLMAYLIQLMHDKTVLEERRNKLEERLNGLQQEKNLLLQRQTSQPPRQAPPEVVSFWKSLPLAEVDAESFLVLQNGTFFLGDEDLGRELYVRESYKRMHDHIRSLVAENTLRRLVITGTPGIGKSVFAFYFLYRLSCEGKTVVFQSGAVWYRFGEDGAQEGGRKDFMSSLKRRDVWYLSDPPAGKGPFEEAWAVTLAFMSPRVERYKEFLKKPLATTRFMSVWDTAELECCRSRMYPQLSVEKMDELYSMWGGVPRYVLQFWEDSRQQVKLDTAIHSISTEDVLQWIATGGETKGLVQDQTSDKLFHIVTCDFENITATWASCYAETRVLDKVGELGVVKILAHIESSKGMPDAAGGRGILFEACVHHFFAKGGGHIQVRSLEVSETAREVEWRPTRTEFFHTLETLDGVEPDVYYVPSKKTQVTFDSFMVSGGCVLAFQITVSERHGIKVKGVKALADALHRLKIVVSERKLVFIVPADKFSVFRKQSYKGVEGRVVEPSNIVASFGQYVVQYPTLHNTTHP